MYPVWIQEHGLQYLYPVQIKETGLYNICIQYGYRNQDCNICFQYEYRNQDSIICKTVSSMDTGTWRKGGKPPKARRGYHPAVSSTLMFRATNYTYQSTQQISNLSLYPSIVISIYLFLNLSVFISIFLYICSCLIISHNILSIYLSLYPSFFLPIFNTFKGTVSVISSHPPCKDGTARFTTVPLKIFI